MIRRLAGTVLLLAVVSLALYGLACLMSGLRRW